MEELRVGSPLPEFSLPVTGGETITNADLAEKIAVLFFYPRDNTSGCTREATEFTAREAEFEAMGAVIFGISKDSVASHEKFAKMRDLSIPLLSDENSDFCERCGVWVEKSMYGKKYMGIERSTILVDTTGTIVKIWRKVKVPGHVDDVFQEVSAISA